MEATATEKYRQRHKELKAETTYWRPLWNDVSEYLLPDKGRYLQSDTEKSINDGRRSYQKIINGSAKEAQKVLSACIQAGQTSPAEPWFALTVPDENLLEIEAVRWWLHEVRNIILRVLAKSNFYDSTHGAYTELGGFGTNAMLIEEDFKTFVRFRTLTIGEYLLALDANYRPDTLYRQFSMTSRQMEEKFGKKNLSDSVQTSLNSSKGETRFEVIHCIQPAKMVVNGMTYESVYYELNSADTDKVLRKAGYTMRPFVASRWDFAGVDVYGTSPGIDALGDIKMLQKMESLKLKKLNKNVDPPMNAPTSMKGRGGTIVAGGINYVDVAQGNQTFTPAYHPDANIQPLTMEIKEVEYRIRRMFHNDLLLSLLDETKRLTATEVVERNVQIMRVLGPTIERQQTEFLEPTIVRVYDILQRFNALPPLPDELASVMMGIEYIGSFARAQRMVGTTAIEQTAAMVGQFAQAKPDVLDKFDFDEAVDQYAVMVGAPPKIIRSDERVAAIRQERIDSQNKMVLAQAAAQASKSAKELGSTKMDQNTALDRVMQGMS